MAAHSGKLSSHEDKERVVWNSLSADDKFERYWTLRKLQEGLRKEAAAAREQARKWELKYLRIQSLAEDP